MKYNTLYSFSEVENDDTKNGKNRLVPSKRNL